MILHIRIFEWNRRVSPTPESFWCCRIFVPGNCVGWFKIGSWTRFAVVWVCTSFWFVSSHATMHLLFVHQLLQILIHFQKMVRYPKWLFPFTPQKHIHVDFTIFHQPRTLNLLFPAAQLLLAWIFFPRLRSSVGFWLGERLGVALDDEDQLGARLGGQGFPLNPMVRGVGLDWLRLPSPEVKVYIPQT